MNSNVMLERLVARDRYQEILSAMTPRQLSVIALRLDGMNSPEIAEALGIYQGAVSFRVEGARRRVLGALPELEKHWSGRKWRRRVNTCYGM